VVRYEGEKVAAVELREVLGDHGLELLYARGARSGDGDVERSHCGIEDASALGGGMVPRLRSKSTGTLPWKCLQSWRRERDGSSVATDAVAANEPGAEVVAVTRFP